MKHLTDAIMAEAAKLRSEAGAQGMDSVWIRFESSIVGEPTWNVSISARKLTIHSVEAKDLRAAFNEALRRVTWERDEKMKLIAAE